MKTLRQVLFVQGGGKGAHDEWDDKLVASLARELGDTHEVQYPQMPGEDDPHFDAWTKALGKALAALPDGAIAVGHSIGGTILVKAIADRPPPRKLGALFLLAPPFLGPGGWPAEDSQIPADLGRRLPLGLAVHLFQGLADEVVPPSHVDSYARAIPQAKVHRLEERDHQLNDDLKEVARAILALPPRR